MFRKVGVALNFFGVARFLQYSLNSQALSIPVVEGFTKIRFKCQGCHEAKKFAEHWFKKQMKKYFGEFVLGFSRNLNNFNEFQQFPFSTTFRMFQYCFHQSDKLQLLPNIVEITRYLFCWFRFSCLIRKSFFFFYFLGVDYLCLSPSKIKNGSATSSFSLSRNSQLPPTSIRSKRRRKWNFQYSLSVNSHLGKSKRNLWCFIIV